MRAEKGTAGRRLELLNAMEKLKAEIDETTAAPAKARLWTKFNKLMDEFNTFYSDER